MALPGASGLLGKYQVMEKMNQRTSIGYRAMGERLRLDYAKVWPVRRRGRADAGVRVLQTGNRACCRVEGEEIEILHRDVSCFGDAKGGLRRNGYRGIDVPSGQAFVKGYLPKYLWPGV